MFRLFFVLLMLTLTTSVVVNAQEGKNISEARAYNQKAIKLFQKEKYIKSADAFRKAYELSYSYKILYNIAQSEAAAKRYGLALDAFEKYLTAGGDEIDTKRQTDVRAEISRLRDLVGFIEITAKKDSKIKIDGVFRGIYPETRRIPVSATVSHEIQSFTANEEDGISSRVRVSGGDTVTIDHTSPNEKSEEATEAETSTVPNVEPENDRKNHQKRMLWISGLSLASVGAAALVGGSICGGLVLTKERLLDNSCNGTVCPTNKQHIMSSRNRLVTTSTILWAAGGTVAATGITLMILSKLKKEEQTALILPNPTGISIMGGF